MHKKIYRKFKKQYSITSIDLGEYAAIDKSGLHFLIKAYDVKGVGRLSIVTMEGMKGIMKMETVILTPNQIDMPIFSYDMVHFAGKTTLLLELYNTCLNTPDVSSIDDIKKEYGPKNDRGYKRNWYDSIRMSPTIKKSSWMKKDKERFNDLIDDWVDELITCMDDFPPVNVEKKNAKNSEYVDGLLTRGGPSTNQFVKMIGKEKTTELFQKYLFGTK